MEAVGRTDGAGGRPAVLLIKPIHLNAYPAKRKRRFMALINGWTSTPRLANRRRGDGEPQRGKFAVLDA